MNGSIFFYSLNGDGSLEWIGSAMIWLLLAMSVVNVVLIALATSANARKGVLPADAPAAMRELLAAGRYKDAVERATRGEDDFSRVLARAFGHAAGGAEAMSRTAEQAADELLAVRLRQVPGQGLQQGGFAGAGGGEQVHHPHAGGREALAQGGGLGVVALQQGRVQRQLAGDAVRFGGGLGCWLSAGAVAAHGSSGWGHLQARNGSRP